MRKYFAIFFSVILFLSFSTQSYAASPDIESIDPEATNEALYFYNMLPSQLRSEFESSGWRIKITDVGTVNFTQYIYTQKMPSGGYVAGFTTFAGKMIILSQTDAGSAINHEFGHYFDMALARNASMELGFKNIYAAESPLFDGGSNSYAQSDAGEYFAEAFREYIECAGYLKSTCPMTYEYIDALVSPYGGTSTLGETSYSRCPSHLIGQIAKDAANGIAELARGAAQAALDGGAKAFGKQAPKVDAWLDKAKTTMAAIEADPGGMGEKWANDLNAIIHDEDAWIKAGADAGNVINRFFENLKKKTEETDWKQKGTDITEKARKFLESLEP